MNFHLVYPSYLSLSKSRARLSYLHLGPPKLEFGSSHELSPTIGLGAKCNISTCKLCAWVINLKTLFPRSLYDPTLLGASCVTVNLMQSALHSNNTGNPGSVRVPYYSSSKITVFVWGKNKILEFAENAN